LSELLNMQPESCAAVYVGDDETDEDAFAALQGRGIGIKVGDASWPTAARGFLADCRAVVGFLRTWVSLLVNSKEG
jgi:trehalose-6-phosphatase